MIVLDENWERWWIAVRIKWKNEEKLSKYIVKQFQPDYCPECTNYHGMNFSFYIQGGPKVSWQTFGLIYIRRVFYLRAVALQIAYCTFLFEDSDIKIWRFKYFRPSPFNIKTPILFSLNMLDAQFFQDDR